MAWPLSRLVDFVAKTTRISAAFLNAVQDWTVSLSLGTVSLKSVLADGTGGASVSPPAGTVTAKRRAAQFDGDQSTPVGQSGEISAGLVPLAWGVIVTDGGGNVTIESHVGIESVVRTATGSWTVYPQVDWAAESVSGTDRRKLCGVASLRADWGLIRCAAQNSGARARVVVNAANTGGSAQDYAFQIVIFGEAP